MLLNAASICMTKNLWLIVYFEYCQSWESNSGLQPGQTSLFICSLFFSISCFTEPEPCLISLFLYQKNIQVGWWPLVTKVTNVNGTNTFITVVAWLHNLELWAVSSPLCKRDTSYTNGKVIYTVDSFNLDLWGFTSFSFDVQRLKISEEVLNTTVERALY